MDVDELRADVSQWITDWVSKRNTALGHPPCPFALQALERNQISWVCYGSLDGLKDGFKSIAEKGLDNEVLVIGLDPTVILPFNLSESTRYANEELLMPAGLVALEDHPHDIELVSGQVMNQGKWALILIQSLEKLNNASLMLSKSGYYDVWTDEQKADVVDWRFSRNPRRG